MKNQWGITLPENESPPLLYESNFRISHPIYDTKLKFNDKALINDPFSASRAQKQSGADPSRADRYTLIVCPIPQPFIERAQTWRIIHPNYPLPIGLICSSRQRENQNLSWLGKRDLFACTPLSAIQAAEFIFSGFES